MFKIQETFYSIQGEGSYVGMPALFIRFGGCDYECSWCDSKRASVAANCHNWKDYKGKELRTLMEEAVEKGYNIILTGGNPLLQITQKNAYVFKGLEKYLHVETQGSAPLHIVVNHLVVSPKIEFLKKDTVLRGEHVRFLREARGKFQTVDIKYPVADDLEDFKDYLNSTWELEKHVDESISKKRRIYITIRNDMRTDYRGISSRFLEDLNYIVKHLRPHKIHIQPQVHVLIWGNKQGV